MTDRLGFFIGGMVHKTHRQRYPEMGGLAGIAKAKAAGASAIDIDVHGTKDGKVAAIHWPADWRVNGKKIKGHVHDYTMADINANWRSTAGRQYRVNPIEKIMEAAVKANLVLCLEAKSNVMLERPEVWARVKANADRLGCKVVVMTIQQWGHTPESRAAWENAAERRLRAAHAAGLKTMLLQRTHVSAARWDFLDAIKGDRSACKDLPASVARLYPGSPHGASCYLSNARAVTARCRKARTAAGL